MREKRDPMDRWFLGKDFEVNIHVHELMRGSRVWLDVELDVNRKSDRDSVDLFRQQTASFVGSFVASFGNGKEFTIETEREADGKWIAEVMELPGVMVYGTSEDEAVAKVKELARRVFGEREG